MNGTTGEGFTVSKSTRTEDADSDYTIAHVLRMNFFFSAQELLRSDKFRYLNGGQLLSLDLEISHAIFVPLANLYTSCGIDNSAAYTEVTCIGQIRFQKMPL